MIHAVSISSGLSSALTGERVVKRYGKEATRFVFMDTLIEDLDNYRFLDQYSKYMGMPITVLTEGRTPYEVARDQHVIPNSLVAPCTLVLKIKMFRAWLATQEQPITIHIGYDFMEQHRIEKTKASYEKLGYSVDFPLLWNPIEYRRYTVVAREDWGIEPPIMYEQGFTHANCGGECVKQGQGDWIRTLIYHPERYARAENWEQNMRKNPINANYTICKYEKDGVVYPITLKELREQYEAGRGKMDLFKLDYHSACVVCGVGDIA